MLLEKVYAVLVGRLNREKSEVLKLQWKKAMLEKKLRDMKAEGRSPEKK